jgi:hypothetical protein
MNITVTEETKKFTPLKFTFTVESQEELDRLGAIFNFGPLMNWFKKDIMSGDCFFYSIFEKYGANVTRSKELYQLFR